MDNFVYYCCVAIGNRVIYAYSRGDRELESLAALTLDRAPPFHIWYLETVGKYTFGFLMENGHIYSAIVDKNLHNSKVVRFLENVRDEFMKTSKKKLKSSLSCSSRITLQEELVPTIRNLISSLENVSQLAADHAIDMPLNQFSNQINGPDPTTSTKAPLLSKPSRHEKKKMKDRSAEGRGVTGLQDEATTSSESNQGGVSSMSLQKSFSSTRLRAQQHARRGWWHHVWIVLTIDVFICLILFGVWLGVCQGFRCISS